MNKTRSIQTLTIDSNVLCCNFINTVYAWRGENLHEYLQNYTDFIAWCKKLNIVDEEQIAILQQEAENDPEKAAKALLKVKEIRQLLYELISAIAAQDKTRYEPVLIKINPFINNALSHTGLVYQGGVFHAFVENQPVNLLSPVWVVLKSLFDLLTQQDITRIKECPRCGWVFFDETKNGRRRWCNPADCGTRDKMMRYNNKKKNFGAK